jgi:hypothetical protein
VPVDPDLGGVGKVGADLDERRAEMPTSAFRPVCRPPGYAAAVIRVASGKPFLPGVASIILGLLRIVTY